MARTQLLGAGTMTIAAALLAAAPPAVPSDVATWFEQDAARTILTTTQEMVVADDTDRPAAYATVEVGTPRQVHRWAAGLLTGDTSSEPIEPVEEWVAPFDGDGSPGGVVTAWREDGAPTLAVFDDDAELAGALTDLPAAARYVPLLELGVHFAVLDEQVHTLVARPPGSAHTAAGEVHALAELRQALPGWLTAAGQASDPTPSPGSRPWLLPSALGTAVAAVVVLGMLVRRAWRRSPTSPEDT